MQTSAKVWYQSIKNWIMELISVRESEFQGQTPTEVRVEDWLDTLNLTQHTPSVDVKSVVSVSDLQVIESKFNEDLALEYANSQTNFDIGSRAEYFNTVSPQLDVELQNIVVNDTQYLFAVINDVILTLNPNIFNLFM
jgi:hypothetical protein